MRRPLLRSCSSRFALALLLPGCLVSFNDYPLGDPNGNQSTAGSGAAGSGAAGGGAAATSSGGTSSGAEAGTADVGGASSMLLGIEPNMVDDFEDGNQAIIEQEGRKGSWYVANDGKGMQTPRAAEPLLPVPLSTARSGSLHGVHTFGGPFPTWGALIGTAFASNGNDALPYDLSGYQGLKLWVRSGATTAFAARQVRLNLPMPGTSPGGGCTACNDHYGADVPLTAKWTQITVPFSGLKQVGFGAPRLPSPDLKHVTALQLMFPPNVSFDLWVDDIELY